MRIRRRAQFKGPDYSYEIPVVMDIQGRDVFMLHIDMSTTCDLGALAVWRVIDRAHTELFGQEQAEHDDAVRILRAFRRAFAMARHSFIQGHKVCGDTAMGVRVTLDANQKMVFEVGISNDFADIERKAMESDNGHIVGP